MLYRIPYTTDEDESGYELMEADSEIAAKRLVMARLRRYGLTGITLSTPIDITVEEPEDAEVEVEEEEEVEEIPSEAGGEPEPPANGGDKGGGGDGNWQSMLDAQEKQWKQMMADAEARAEKRLADQAASFEKRYTTMADQFTEQLNKAESPSATSGASGAWGAGWQGFDPEAKAAGGMSAEDINFMMEGQSPLAAFRQGMRGGLGQAPQSYLAKNYLERFADPARTAYQTRGALGLPMGGAEDFTSFVQNLFSGGGSPRAQLGAMLGGGLSQLAQTGRTQLEGMDPATRRMFEQRINPDITAEGGRESIGDVLNLAYGTQAQRFSPLILQQLRSGLPSQDELYADYVTGIAGGGTGQDPNFARFVQQQFGL